MIREYKNNVFIEVEVEVQLIYITSTYYSTYFIIISSTIYDLGCTVLVSSTQKYS